MGLTDLWEDSKEQLKDKHVQQIIAFAGEGELRDGNTASAEFQEFLSNIPSDLLHQYADQCLQNSFNGSGFALQDIVNQVGRRLGFEVTDGRYRGASGHIGFDGIWKLPEGHVIVLEVKTTDAYRIDLNKLAGYRNELEKEGALSEEASSVLIVVGRKDTGDLEAQIRGSRHAWDMRLISVDALMRLMLLKQEVEDPKIVQRIYDILIPREFTKLDEIVEILFFTAEEIKEEEPAEKAAVGDQQGPKFVPVSFHQACVDRIENRLHRSLIRRTRASYSSSDGSTTLICAVSKEHVKGEHRWFWFAFHPHQKDFLEKGKDSFIAFGCGSEESVLLIPWGDFVQWVDGMNITEREDRFYWHVHISLHEKHFVLHLKKGFDPIDLTGFLLAGEG
ncbi:MAG: hypothetical protein JW883_09400 [Deltaproteobacteria bacterium]|nr:hypothetical protein [Deltaproteobacteria bacterium]